MFHDPGKCFGTSNGLVLVGRSQMGGRALGERRSDSIANIVPMTISLCGVIRVGLSSWTF